MRLAVVAILLSSAVGGAALAEGLRGPKPGEWETTATVEIDGAASARPPSVTSHCVTVEEAKDPAQMATHAPAGCEVADITTSGQTVRWSVTCHLHGSTQTGKGEITYAGDTFSGVTSITMADPKTGEHKMTNRIRGRRVGECTE